MATAVYGPYVVSDITHYANEDDLLEFLQRRFPRTAEQPKPFKYSVSSFTKYS